MSEQEQEQTEQGGGAASSTAVKAIAAAAATGAATYAVRKALSSRNGQDHQDEGEDDEATSEPQASDDSAEDDEDENEESDRSGGKGSLRQLATPPMLAGASRILLPVAEEVADSAGRYVAEHAPDEVRDRIVPRFIKAFEKAS